MTEHEVSTRLEVIRAGLLRADVEVVSSEENIETIDAAIDAIEEVQKYRAIGTPEECRAAVEKQAEKKVLHNEKAKRYFCPICERKCNYMHSLYCSGCGQKLDWSDEE